MKNENQKWLFGGVGLVIGVIVAMLVGNFGNLSGSSVAGNIAGLKTLTATKITPSTTTSAINQSPIDREDLIKLLVTKSGATINTTGGPHFADITTSNADYPYVETAYNNGWLTPYPNGTFNPKGTVTRPEAAKFIVQVFNLANNTAGAPHFNDSNSSYWFDPYVETLYNWSVVSPDASGNFNPNALFTNGDAQQWIAGAMSPVRK